MPCLQVAKVKSDEKFTKYKKSAPERGYKKILHEKTWRIIPREPCDPNYNLHDVAGGSPLVRFTAPNVRVTSKRRREVCDRRTKYSVP